MVRGSTIPKVFRWSIPSSISACAWWYIFKYFDLEDVEITKVETTAMAIFFSAIGFLLVFRTAQANARFSDGAVACLKVRGNWYYAASSMVAFCSEDPTKQKEVDDCVNLIVRLMSLMYACCLENFSSVPRMSLDNFGHEALDKRSLEYLQNEEFKVEVIMQWLQQIIVRAMDSKIIDIPPPILTRVFHELSMGMDAINQAQRLAAIPFPMPYAQLQWVLLVTFTIGAPPVLALYANVWQACMYAFVGTTVYWCIHYVSVEIEMPFGTDENDLPLQEFQEDMNRRLITLLCVRKRPCVSLVQPEFRTDLTADLLSAKVPTLNVSIDQIPGLDQASERGVASDECMSDSSTHAPERRPSKAAEGLIVKITKKEAGKGKGNRLEKKATSFASDMQNGTASGEGRKSPILVDASGLDHNELGVGGETPQDSSRSGFSGCDPWTKTPSGRNPELAHSTPQGLTGSCPKDRT